MHEFETLLDAIESSPLLEREQKLILIASIEAGEPYSEELLDSILEFLKAALQHMEIDREDLDIRLQEINTKIRDLENPEVIQDKAKKIIALVNNFLAEMKKIDKKFDTEIEQTVQGAETEEISSIRQSLHSGKSRPGVS